MNEIKKPQKRLQAPFRWENRQPALIDRTLFIPKYYSQHADFILPLFEHPDLFGRQAPIFIEYCSGNGDWVIEKALQFPEYNWVAVEKRFDRIRKIWSKSRQKNISNLLLVSGEAWTFSKYYLPANSIAGCFINFPDPWPKERHAKHRLFQTAFIYELNRIVNLGAHITVATDESSWLDQIVNSFLENQQDSQGFQPVFKNPFFVTEWPNYGFSYFGQLWREKGKVIHYFQFKKSADFPTCNRL